MDKRYFKIKRSDLIEFLRTKTKNPDYFIPKNANKLEIKPDGNDINEGCLTVFIKV